MEYTWGYHSTDSGHVHVALVQGENHDRDELFDVALYDPEYIDPATGVDGQEQSLRDLRKLIGYANAALKAGLEPEPVPDRLREETYPGEQAAKEAVRQGVWEEA
jgi:hypothetical protein